MDYNTVKIKVHSNGKIKYVKLLLDNKLHNTRGPAKLVYDENEVLRAEYYYINGKKCRLYAPAVIKYHSNGNPRKLEYFYKDLKHNKYGPAVVKIDKYGNKKCEIHYNMNTLHNLDGPAYSDYIHNEKKWVINGKII